MTFLEDFKLLSPTQFGFRKKRNTELAVTLLLDEIRQNTDIGNVTGTIFIDLSNAFDTLSHAQIIESLTSTVLQVLRMNFLLTTFLEESRQFAMRKKSLKQNLLHVESHRAPYSVHCCF